MTEVKVFQFIFYLSGFPSALGLLLSQEIYTVILESNCPNLYIDTFKYILEAFDILETGIYASVPDTGIWKSKLSIYEIVGG